MAFTANGKCEDRVYVYLENEYIDENGATKF